MARINCYNSDIAGALTIRLDFVRDIGGNFTIYECVRISYGGNLKYKRKEMWIRYGMLNVLGKGHVSLEILNGDIRWKVNR